MTGERIPEFDEPKADESKVNLDDGLDMLDRAATRVGADKPAVQAQLHLLASIAVSLYEMNIAAKNLDERLPALLERLGTPQYNVEVPSSQAELVREKERLRGEIAALRQEYHDLWAKINVTFETEKR